MTLEIAPQLLVAGLSTGSIYGLVALGLVLAFKGTGLLNFAQGEFVALGAYVALFLSVLTPLPFYAVFVLTLVLAGIFGAVLERALLRPLIKAPIFTVVIATLAIGLIIKNVLRLSWQETVSSLPSPFANELLLIGSMRINAQYAWIIACTLVLALALAAFFRSSRIGKAMRAVAQNRDAAALMGIPVNRMYSLTIAISTVVGALAGMLVAPLTGVESEMGSVVIKGFVAAIVGGFYSMPGALVGGLLLGVLETFGGIYVGGVFKNLVAFFLLIVVLLIRPHGLFGRAEARRV